MSSGEPDYICPYIDSVIDEVDNATSSLQEIITCFNKNYQPPNKGALEDIYDVLSPIGEEMEKIRSLIEDLRSWGRSGHKEVEELEGRVEELQDEVSDLQGQLFSMEKDIHALQKEIDVWNEYEAQLG